MAETDIPKFRLYAEGEVISPVDPEDLQRFWKLKPPWSSGNDVELHVAPEQILRPFTDAGA
jgi:hypothetical protein